MREGWGNWGGVKVKKFIIFTERNNVYSLFIKAVCLLKEIIANFKKGMILDKGIEFLPQAETLLNFTI